MCTHCITECYIRIFVHFIKVYTKLHSNCLLLTDRDFLTKVCIVWNVYSTGGVKIIGNYILLHVAHGFCGPRK